MFQHTASRFSGMAKESLAADWSLRQKDLMHICLTSSSTLWESVPSPGGRRATFWSPALARGHSMPAGESMSAQSRFAKVFAKVYGNHRGRSTEAHTFFSTHEESNRSFQQPAFDDICAESSSYSMSSHNPKDRIFVQSHPLIIHQSQSNVVAFSIVSPCCSLAHVRF